MTTAPVVESPLAKVPQHPPRAISAAIALASFATLLLELALTRLFSVVLFYHFAFLAISVALLGLGAGGVFSYLKRAFLDRFETRRLAAVLCGMNAVAMVLVLLVVLHSSISLDLNWRNAGLLTVLYLAAAVPFFFTGVLFSVVFARRAGQISQLYGADLVGGAAACLAVVPVLNWLGGPNAVLTAAVAMAAAAVIWGDRLPTRFSMTALSLALIGLVAINHSGRFLDIVYAKGMRRDAPWVVFSKWNAISRVEVNLQQHSPVIVIDADASTYIMSADPKQLITGDMEQMKRLKSSPPSVVNALRPQGHYAIIGPGGGVDVVRALAFGSPRVTAIEINPIIANTIMRGLYAEYSGNLYSRPEVDLHVADGRSFIRSSRDRYDVLQMTLVDTWASTAAGAFALSENNLYTVNAFREYFDHLNDAGIIAITRWEFRQPREALRVVSQAMAALRGLGVTDFHRHFVVVVEGGLDEDGRPVAVLAKKSPLTEEEEAQVRRHLAENPALRLLYLPSEPSDNAFSHLIASADPELFARSYAFNVAPVTDDAPFFFFTLKTGQALRTTLAGAGRGIDWKNNLGLVVLGILLVLSILAVLAFLVVPLLLGTRDAHVRVLPLLYFVAVGLGYIVVEIAFIQRFVLFLGHPTYALTVVVFLMLLSSGIGSYVARRWFPDPTRIWVAAVIVVAASLVYLLVLPTILSSLVGLPFAAKLLLSAAILAPLGFVMGMPFPTGIRALSGAGQQTVEWAWAMNAASSVLGSVSAVVIAIHWGLNVALLTGALAYAAAALLVRSFPRLTSNV
jgi:spermidine synthase